MTPSAKGAGEGDRGRPTMREVAAWAGVSIKTVSRVVNAERGVRPEVQDKVHSAIEVLGYRRNEVARNLRPGQRSHTVGLVIEDIGNPFYSAVTRGVEEVARERGVMVLSASSDEDPARERALLGRMLRQQVDGLLIVPAGQDHEFLSGEMRHGTPVVFVDRPGGNLDTDVAVLDNRGGVRQAVTLLVSRGHQRIGLVGDGEWIWTAAERLAGYKAALRSVGLQLDPAIVRLGPHTAQEAQEAVAGLMAVPEPPTAIVALNNRMTIGALRAMRNEDAGVDIVGFDDLEFADLLARPIAVVAHDSPELGRAAAKMLFARLDGDRRPPQKVTVETTIVLRR